MGPGDDGCARTYVRADVHPPPRRPRTHTHTHTRNPRSGTPHAAGHITHTHTRTTRPPTYPPNKHTHARARAPPAASRASAAGSSHPWAAAAQLARRRASSLLAAAAAAAAAAAWRTGSKAQRLRGASVHDRPHADGARCVWHVRSVCACAESGALKGGGGGAAVGCGRAGQQWGGRLGRHTPGRGSPLARPLARGGEVAQQQATAQGRQ